MTNVSVSLHPGYIRVPLAYHNHYLVSTDVGELTAVALESGSGRRSGHIGSGSYMPGATVLVAKMNAQQEFSRNANLPCLILGAFDPFPSISKDPNDESSVGTDFDITEQVPGSFSNVNKNAGPRTAVELDARKFINQDRAKNRAMDTLPGEWFKSTVLGGIFLLSDFLARVGVSPHCNITFHGLNDTAELRTKNFIRDMESRCLKIAQRGFGSLEVDSYALNVYEGLGAGTTLGVLQDAAEELNPSRLAALSEEQAGFFRRMLMRGGDADGSWEVIKMDPEIPEFYTNAARPWQGLVSEMRRLDGIYRLAAAKEIKLEKTGMIMVPSQIGDLINTPTSDTPPPEDNGLVDDEELGLAFELSDDQQAALRPLLHKDFASYEEQNMFFKTMKQDDGIWVFPDSPVDEVTYGTLSDDQQEYTVEDLTNLLTDAVEVYPGRRVKLFKNSSVFLMSEDGGIVLGDGFGAEIRMNRGKVTISAAGDIDILPGRDTRMLSPRNLIQKARDRVEVSATRGSVNLKAEENMQLLSGNGGDGILTLENRGAEQNLADIQDRQITDGLALGSGILIKSHNAGVAMLGRYIYGGPYTPRGSLSTEGVLNSNRQCEILLDSGAGNTMLTGAAGMFTYSNALMLAMRDTATGLYLDSNTLLCAARGQVSLSAPDITMEKSQGSVKKPYLTESGVKSRSQALPSTEPQLIVQGGLQVKESVYVKGAVVAEQHMSANDGFNGQHVLIGRERFSESIATPTTTNISNLILNTTGRVGSLLQSMVDQGIATQRGQKATDFTYPESDSPAFHARDFSLVIPRWQQLLQTSTQWVENSVHSAIFNTDTYPFPGREIYSGSSRVLHQPGTNNKGIASGTMNSYPVNG